MVDGPSDLPSSPAEPSTSASPSPGGEVLSSTPPPWFEVFASEIRGKLGDHGKQLAKYADRLNGAANGGTPKASPAANGGTPTAETDVLGALKLGRTLAKLPDEAQAHLESLLEQGRSARDVAEVAETLLKFGAGGTPSAKAQAPNPPPGIAGTAPAQTAHHSWPKTQAELVELMASDPEKYKRLMDPKHPFDPLKLPPF